MDGDGVLSDYMVSVVRIPDYGWFMTKLDRSVASEDADAARNIARPGESHAAARERFREAVRDSNRRRERLLLWGAA